MKNSQFDLHIFYKSAIKLSVLSDKYVGKFFQLIEVNFLYDLVLSVFGEYFDRCI